MSDFGFDPETAPATKPASLAKHPTETPEYWRRLAAIERRAAVTERGTRWATVESIMVHERNAADYDNWAAKLEAGLA